jgi:hypothetical protein
MDAAQITPFGQLPENQSGLVLAYWIGMLPVAICRSHVRFPSHLNRIFPSFTPGATIVENQTPGGDCHHQKV